jgi:hypothetical protein
MPFVCTMYLKIVRQYSRGELVSFDWLCHQIGWPFSPPDTILDLVHLEAVHDVLDLYMWLSYRFPVSSRTVSTNHFSGSKIGSYWVTRPNFKKLRFPTTFQFRVNKFPDI